MGKKVITNQWADEAVDAFAAWLKSEEGRDEDGPYTLSRVIIVEMAEEL